MIKKPKLLEGVIKHLKYSQRAFAMVLIITMAIITAPMLSVSTVSAQNKRVVIVHVDGQTLNIPTTANTVEQVLDRSGIDYTQNDLIEPSIDTEIMVDTFNINIFRARPVLVLDGDQRSQVLSPYQSPRLIAESAGFTVYPEDLFELERINDFVNEGTLGLKLTIIRSTPIELDLYGTKITVRTHTKTVQEFLDQSGVALAQSDIVRPALDSGLSTNQTVHVVQVGNGRKVVEEPVAFSERIIKDSSRLTGYRQVQSAGVTGAKLVTYDVVLENDKEVSRNYVSHVVTTQPQEQVIVVGTKIQNPNDNVSLGQSIAAQKGWVDSQWTCLYELWMRESRWSHTATNPSSGAYGIPQSLPGSKMASVAGDWQTNPATQITWGLEYISGRYGSPCQAWNFFLSNNWY